VRRAWYTVAALLILAGLLGLIPLVRLRIAGTASAAATNVASHTALRTDVSPIAGGPVYTAAGSFAATSGSLGAKAPSATAAAPARTLGRIWGSLPRRLVRPQLVVEKTGRTVTVFSAGKAVKVYRIALGRSPDGDKERAGDDRTPLGRFYICNKNAQSRFGKSLGLSYPNVEDAKRGLKAGLISGHEERAIVEAVENRQQPPWSTRLGGQIMIHGGGTERDWTTGCVALSNADINELFAEVPVGTAVVIEERPALQGTQPGQQIVH
jgi:hypothetical protein